MKTQLNELALFAGAGGGILGGHLLGWRTICAVEWDAYAASVLVARQNDGCLPPFPIWDDVQTFDGRPWRGRIDVVSGGFPCQDISCAGKGAGIEGERSSMWKHMARIIGEVRPRYAFVENSPMLVGRGLATVLSDLAEMGYDAKWGIVGAHNVAAPHKRDRIWLLSWDSNRVDDKTLREICGGKIANASGIREPMANANLRGCNDGRDTERQHEADHAKVGQTAKDQQSGSFWEHRISENGCDVADSASRESWQQTEWKRRENTIGGSADCRGDSGEREEVSYPASSGFSHGCDVADSNVSQRERMRCAIGSEQEYADFMPFSAWWGQDPAEAPKSNVGRMADGIPARVDRLRCLGNAQVPAVAQLAWKTLNT